MKIILVDGVFKLIGGWMIVDPRDDFMHNIVTNHMMDRMIAINSYPNDSAERKEALELVDTVFMEKIPLFKGEELQVDVVPLTQFEKSAPGFIYICDTIKNLRTRRFGRRILLLLKDPTQNMYLDVVINPYMFGYGMELPDIDPGEMAWLAVEPGLANPLKITPVEYASNRDYLHFMVYS